MVICNGDLKGGIHFEYVSSHWVSGKMLTMIPAIEFVMSKASNHLFRLLPINLYQNSDVNDLYGKTFLCSAVHRAVLHASFRSFVLQ